MAEPPPALHQGLPPLLPSPSPVPRPPSPAPPALVAAPPSMAEPPPALPQSLPLLPQPSSPLPQPSSPKPPPLPQPPTPRVVPQPTTLHVGAGGGRVEIGVQNPRIGDSGQEEDGMAEECARLIQSYTYTVDVKICSSETEINGDASFSWQIEYGCSSNMKDLLACIAGTFFFPLCSENNISVEYVDSTSGKIISVSNDEECLKMYDCFHQNRGGNLIIKHVERTEDNLDVPCIASNQTPSVALPSQPSEASRITDTYLANPHEEYDDHLWPAAYSWNPRAFDYHMSAIQEKKAAAIAYLNKYHSRLWSRSKYSTFSKVDYVTNNLAECFNNWIHKHKGLMLFQLVDKVRRKITVKGVTIEDFVDDYYSVAKFTAAYAPILPGLTDMSQWPSVHKEFFLNPPILRRAPGRPKVQRHKSGAENSKGKGKKGQQQCPICKEFGHRWQSCKNAAPEALEAYAEVAKQKRYKRKKPMTKAICTTSDQAIEGTVAPLSCTTETALAIEDNAAKSTSPKTTSKSKRSKIISAAPDSPAMSTRSKKRAAPSSQPMATRSKKKLKL